jgi:hypothetical protein
MSIESGGTEVARGLSATDSGRDAAGNAEPRDPGGTKEQLADDHASDGLEHVKRDVQGNIMDKNVMGDAQRDIYGVADPAGER